MILKWVVQKDKYHKIEYLNGKKMMNINTLKYLQ